MSDLVNRGTGAAICVKRNDLLAAASSHVGKASVQRFEPDEVCVRRILRVTLWKAEGSLRFPVSDRVHHAIRSGQRGINLERNDAVLPTKHLAGDADCAWFRSIRRYRHVARRHSADWKLVDWN